MEGLSKIDLVKNGILLEIKTQLLKGISAAFPSFDLNKCICNEMETCIHKTHVLIYLVIFFHEHTFRCDGERYRTKFDDAIWEYFVSPSHLFVFFLFYSLAIFCLKICPYLLDITH